VHVRPKNDASNGVFLGTMSAARSRNKKQKREKGSEQEQRKKRGQGQRPERRRNALLPLNSAG
jgi:hypothetical protein